MGDHERVAPEPAHPTLADGELSVRGITQRQAIQMLSLDALAIEVISILTDAGVPSLLLKGPVLASVLYDDGTPRPYRDCDVLVPEVRLAQAGQALRAAGLQCDFDEREVPARINPYSQFWRKPGSPSIVDLHWTLDGVGAGPDVLWTEFADDSLAMRFHNTSVRVPSPARIALLAALHAAHHGGEHAKPLEDLRRALDRFGPEVWEEAAQLAIRLDATDAWVAGLSLSETGAALVASLGLSADPQAWLSIRHQRRPRGAVALARVLDTPGFRAKLQALCAVAFPPARYMRYSFPLARRGPVALLAAYAQRLVTWIPQIPAAVRAIRAGRSD